MPNSGKPRGSGLPRRTERCEYRLPAILALCHSSRTSELDPTQTFDTRNGIHAGALTLKDSSDSGENQWVS